jgi:hypothetical protein
VVSLRVLWLSVEEGRDMIATTLIFIIMQRLVIQPAAIYMSIWLYISYDDLRQVNEEEVKKWIDIVFGMLKS